MAKKPKTEAVAPAPTPEPYMFKNESWSETRPDVLLHEPAKGEDYPPAVTIRRYMTNAVNERKMIEVKVFNLVEQTDGAQTAADSAAA